MVRVGPSHCQELPPSFPCGNPSTWAINHCFLRPSAENWIRREAAKTWTGTTMRFHCLRQCFYLLHHNPGLHLLCFVLSTALNSKLPVGQEPVSSFIQTCASLHISPGALNVQASTPLKWIGRFSLLLAFHLPERACPTLSKSYFWWLSPPWQETQWGQWCSPNWLIQGQLNTQPGHSMSHSGFFHSRVGRGVLPLRSQKQERCKLEAMWPILGKPVCGKTSRV